MTGPGPREAYDMVMAAANREPARRQRPPATVAPTAQRNGHTPDNAHYYDGAPPITDEPPARSATQHDSGTADELDPHKRWVVIPGGAFILDQPAAPPALWGEGDQVLWAEGESLMIGGPQGVGKTTLVGQLTRCLLGLDTELLGLPVQPIDGPILYLAMDRPAQIARSLARQFTAKDRSALNKSLMVRKGPPPADLAANPTILAAMATDLGAAIVVVDSVKDAALGLSNDEVGAAYNRARQYVLQGGIQHIDLHHTKKRQPNSNPGKDIEDLYGSTWLTAGCGSVILVAGEPGDPIVGFRHVKQPAGEVGPFKLRHDQTAGQLTIFDRTDLVELAHLAGPDGLTAKDAAVALYDPKGGKPTDAQLGKARRALDKHVTDGALRCLKGNQGGSDHSRRPSSWFPTTPTTP